MHLPDAADFLNELSLLLPLSVFFAAHPAGPIRRGVRGGVQETVYGAIGEHSPLKVGFGAEPGAAKIRTTQVDRAAEIRAFLAHALREGDRPAVQALVEVRAVVVGAPAEIHGL